MKKIICLLMTIAIMLSFAACGKKNVEGTWLDEDGETGYKLGEISVERDGEKMGEVDLLPEEDGINLLNISYYYRYIDKNTIEIIRFVPTLSGGGIGVEEEEYDVLRMEKENGVQVLVSEETGECYYQSKS